MTKFKVGDKVRIRRNSEYAHQSNEVGIVGAFNDKWYHVDFPHSNNSYQEHDLELVGKKEIKVYGIVKFLEQVERK